MNKPKAEVKKEVIATNDVFELKGKKLKVVHVRTTRKGRIVLEAVEAK